MALAPEAETDDNQKKNGSTVYHKHGDGYTLSITISADEMSASISLKPEQKKEDLISVETLLDIISTHNIVDGIDMAVLTDICNKACAGKEQQNIVIATTHPPLPGADGWLEPLIQDKKLKFKEDDRGRVDLYTLNNIATVAIDQQIAILHPPQLGEASSTVTGKVLQPLAGKELEIRMGEGIRFDDDDDGISFVSTAAGRAEICDGTISVSEDYIIHGDVDLQVGNINFPGRTNIRGDVLDNFDIYSQKGIVIAGAVGSCHLISDGDITVGSMSGNNDGLIRCNGNLKANYLNGATIECMGSVTVSNEIRNCIIKSADTIMVKNGVISGGECIALNGIEAKDIGATAGVITKLQSGVYFPETDRLQLLKTQQKSISIQKQFIQRSLGSLDIKKVKNSSVAEALQKRLEILTERLEILEELGEKVKQELNDFVFEDYENNAKINVHRRLKEKVIISLETITEEIRFEHSGPLSVVADVPNGMLRFCEMTPLSIQAEDAEWEEEEQTI